MIQKKANNSRQPFLEIIINLNLYTSGGLPIMLHHIIGPPYHYNLDSQEEYWPMLQV